MSTQEVTLSLAARIAIEHNVRQQIADNVMLLQSAGKFDAGCVITHAGLQAAATEFISDTVAQVYQEILQA